MEPTKQIPPEVCGPDSPVDWGYPETGQVSPPRTLIEELRSCDRVALAERLRTNQPVLEQQLEALKRSRYPNMDTLNLTFGI
jgi:hypothetical protein